MQQVLVFFHLSFQKHSKFPSADVQSAKTQCYFSIDDYFKKKFLLMSRLLHAVGGTRTSVHASKPHGFPEILLAVGDPNKNPCPPDPPNLPTRLRDTDAPSPNPKPPPPVRPARPGDFSCATGRAVGPWPSHVLPGSAQRRIRLAVDPLVALASTPRAWRVCLATSAAAGRDPPSPPTRALTRQLQAGQRPPQKIRPGDRRGPRGGFFCGGGGRAV